MKLSIRQRLLLLPVLPEKGSLLTIRIVRELREALSFDEGEIVEFNLMQNNGRVTWDESKDKGKEIDIGPRAQTIILDRLKELDSSQALTTDHLEICELFGYNEGSTP
jgi:hypothetical protein